MRLRVQTPTQVLIDEPADRVIAEGEHGSFGLLPNHVDFLAALTPGMLSFVDESGGEQFAAVDAGILVKRGDEVLVSTRQATRGTRLEELRATLRDEFAALDEQERAAHAATAELEAGFLRRYLEFAENAG